MSARFTNGIQAEAIVIDYYVSRGYRLLGRRVRSYFAELDLVFRRDCDPVEPFWVLCEVKLQRRNRSGLSPISENQCQRLRRAHLAFVAHNGPSEFHLAIVDEFGRVDVVENFLAQ